MPFSFHRDQTRKADFQYLLSREYIIPWVKSHFNPQGKRVLEIGCAEGGVLSAFLETGATCIGVDISIHKTDFARKRFSTEIADNRMRILTCNLLDEQASVPDDLGTFDLIILKDVIEHIENKNALLLLVQKLLRRDGLFFVGFPPWKMPFGGHQQMANSLPGRLPWMHLLPEKCYCRWFSLLGESAATISELIGIHRCGITISGFQVLMKKQGFRLVKARHWLLNPIYRYKFGLLPLEAPPFLPPPLLEYLCTGVFYLLRRVELDNR